MNHFKLTFYFKTRLDDFVLEKKHKDKWKQMMKKAKLQYSSCDQTEEEIIVGGQLRLNLFLILLFFEEMIQFLSTPLFYQLMP